MVSLTTGMIFAATPLDCQYCTDAEICNWMDQKFNFSENPGMNAKWAKKYCTKFALTAIIKFFPLLVLFSPLVILLFRRIISGKYLKIEIEE